MDFFCFLSQIDLCLSVGIELNSRDSHAELRRRKRRKRKNGMNCWFIPQSDAEQRERDVIVFLFPLIKMQQQTSRRIEGALGASLSLCTSPLATVCVVRPSSVVK